MYIYHKSSNKMTEPLYFHFGGSIRSVAYGNAYNVIFNGQKGRTFNFDEYGGIERAKEAAIIYQQMTSDILGRSTWIFPSIYSYSIKQWVSTFIDGDGNIGVRNGYPHIGASQSQNSEVPVIFIFLQKLYGGQIRKKKKIAEHHRQAYEWNASCGPALVAINDVAEHGFLKRDIARVIIDYVRRHNTLKCSDIAQQVKAMHGLAYYLSVPIDAARMTSAHCGGLFCAEGCAFIQMKSSPVIDFCQKSSPAYLQAINKFYGNTGSIGKNSNLRFFGKNAERVMKDILPFLMGPKRDQVQLLQSAYTLGKTLPQGVRRPNEMKEELQNMATQCKKLKYI